MTTWTPERVADRFQEAALTARRLPPVTLQGYANSWPGLVRQPWEGYGDARAILRIPPSPDTLDRFDSTVRWLRWLDVEQRHLVWARAAYVPWREIAIRAACDRKTARRRWQHALTLVTVQLNGSLPRLAQAQSA